MTDEASGSAGAKAGGSAGGRWVPPEPGPLAEEAALLAAVVRDWLTAHGAPPPSTPPAAGEEAQRGDAEGWDAEGLWAADAAGDAGAAEDSGAAGPVAGGWPWALAPGATMCTGCPLCRLLATVVGNRPEVMFHLMAALSELAAAVRAAWAPPAGPDGWGSGTDGGQAGDEDAGGAAAGADHGGHVPPGRPGGRRSRPSRQRVQRIDIQ